MEKSKEENIQCAYRRSHDIGLGKESDKIIPIPMPITILLIFQFIIVSLIESRSVFYKSRNSESLLPAGS